MFELGGGQTVFLELLVIYPPPMKSFRLLNLKFRFFTLAVGQSIYALEERVTGAHGPTKTFATPEERLAYANAQLRYAATRAEYENFRTAIGDANPHVVLRFWERRGVAGYDLTVDDAIAEYEAAARRDFVGDPVHLQNALRFVCYARRIAAPVRAHKMKLLERDHLETAISRVTDKDGEPVGEATRVALFGALNRMYNFVAHKIGSYNPLRGVKRDRTVPEAKYCPIAGVHAILEQLRTTPSFAPYAARLLCYNVLGAPHRWAASIRPDEIVLEGDTVIMTVWPRGRSNLSYRVVLVAPAFAAYFKHLPPMPVQSPKPGTLRARQLSAVRAAGLNPNAVSVHHTFYAVDLAERNNPAQTARDVGYADPKIFKLRFDLGLTRDDVAAWHGMRPLIGDLGLREEE